MQNKYIKDLVSIVIPTFGRSESLLKAIESVKRQTYSAIEVIVVDDNGLGSECQMATYEMVQKYNIFDFKLKYLPLEKNSGGSAARNSGALIAQGEYLCFLDDDDEFLHEKIDNQVRLLVENHNFIACYCSHVRKNIEKNESKTMIMTESGDLLYPLLMFKIDACTGSSLMLHHWVFDVLEGFSTFIQRMQDYEFVIRLAHIGEIGVVVEPQVIINTHSGSYKHRNLKAKIETRKQFINIISPILTKLTNEQRQNVLLNLYVENIMDTIRFKKYDKAIILIINSHDVFHTINLLYKRLIKKIKKNRKMNVQINKIIRSIIGDSIVEKIKTTKSAILFYINPRFNINISYKKKFKNKINWNKPSNLIEKIWWMLFNTDTLHWSMLADKYESRLFVEKMGYANMLNELYGVFDDINQINFDTLPSQFVIKTTNACGTNIIVKNKSKLDIKKTKYVLNKWLKFRYGILNSSIHYLQIKPRIIVEKFLEDISQPALIDYKIWCFNGEPECILVVSERSNSGYKLNLYDLNWKSISYHITKHRNNIEIKMPFSLNIMLDACRAMSKGLEQVRIDFYEIKGEVIFGEFTLTTGFGYFTEEYYQYLGSKIDLPPRTSK